MSDHMKMSEYVTSEEINSDKSLNKVEVDHRLWIGTENHSCIWSLSIVCEGLLHKIKFDLCSNITETITGSCEITANQ